MFCDFIDNNNKAIFFLIVLSCRTALDSWLLKFLIFFIFWVVSSQQWQNIFPTSLHWFLPCMDIFTFIKPFFLEIENYISQIMLINTVK